MNIHPPRLALRACMILAGIAGLAVSTTDASAQSEHRPRLVTADPGSVEWESHGDNVADKPKPRLVRYVVGNPPDDDPGGDDDADDDELGGFEWTVLTPSQDSRMIYVSSSMGNDASDGSRDAPVRTILHARTFVRDGHPDWILLKRGDVFREGVRWWKSGRSHEEPLVITSYGNDAAARPIIAPDLRTEGFSCFDNTTRHLSISGIHFRAPSDGSGHVGIQIISRAGEDFLIEDCRIEGFKDGLVLKAMTNMRVRGNTVIDSAAPFGGHSQGLFASGINGLMIEGNIFDHNGWRDDDTASPTMFNHNIYILGNAEYPALDVVVRNNVLSRASSFGIKIAAHDPQSVVSLDIKENLFLSNGNGCVLGDRVEYGIVDAEVCNNVFTDIGRTINSVDQSLGLTVGGADNVLIERNYFIDKEFHGTTYAIRLYPYPTGMIRGAQIRDNIVYDWRWGSIVVHAERVLASVVENNVVIDFDDAKDLMQLDQFGSDRVLYRNNAYYGDTDLFTNLFRIDGVRVGFDEWLLTTQEVGATDASAISFVDPERDVTKYMQSLGLEPSREQFIERARALSRQNWDSRFEAASVVEYVAEGFLRQP